MKVVFIKDVPKVGRKHEVKEVTDGYAYNFLLPKKLVERATPRLLAEIESMGLKHSTEEAMNRAFFKKYLETLKDTVVVVRAKANDRGHLFAGIHKEEVCRALKEQTGIELSAEMLCLDKPIREAGITKILVQGYDQEGFLTLEVRKE